MQRTRYTALGILAVVMVGSLAATLGYAWYLRGDRYRRYCAQQLSEALGLPSDIGRIVPRSWSSRQFDDVEVWLPQRRGKALSCRRALVINTPREDDPEAYEIELLGGTCEISTRTWLREDYRRVIESGLRPGFDPEGPQRVRFTGMDLHFERDRFRGSLADASGVVVFEGLQHGWATISCNALNGHVTRVPVVLNARFSSQAGGIRIDELQLKVPDLPLHVLGLDGEVGVGLRSGTFNGQLLYTESEPEMPARDLPVARRRLTISGHCFDVSLAECTAGLTPRPWRGTCPELDLRELTFENSWPKRLRFRGVLTGVSLGDLLAPWGLEDAGGELILRVRDADLSPTGIERLVASGQCVGVSLDAVTQALGLGRMSGTARLVIEDLTVEQNRLTSLDALVQVESNGEPRWIEGRLVTELISRVLHMEVPAFLPERIEYTQLGLRLDVRDEVLYVFGTHGPRGKTILTVRLLEQDVPLIVEPKQPFDLRAWFDHVRARAATHVQSRLDELAAQRAATTQPYPERDESADPGDPPGS